ncbi:MAG: methyltransferase domain-containing protein [Pseudonocardiales bacterium]|nr:methyltransferase domain-containing protein [Pseudonocardiales bacterium]
MVQRRDPGDVHHSALAGDLRADRRAAAVPRRGRTDLGISVSREQIAVANSLAESVGLAERVVFQQENAMEMLFPAQSFDAAIALESIPHMPDRGQVLTQICRSLRPGDRPVLTDFLQSGLEAIMFGDEMTEGIQSTRSTEPASIGPVMISAAIGAVRHRGSLTRSHHRAALPGWALARGAGKTSTVRC